ncbi:MAG: hypothetical protein OTJ45_02935 [Alphaproteobacteria bacterium]|nr:hypothetical protein [Alphaproteobacteria bacterium]
MPSKRNPLKLNKLQLKTLTLLQTIAALPDVALSDPKTGNAVLRWLPDPHGNHFHIGDAVVMARDATGLHNPAVWVALERKGLAADGYPNHMAVTPAGLGYDTGLGETILQRADH